MPTIWSKDEIAYLRNNAAMGSDHIAKKLNRTKSQVTMKAYVERISLKVAGKSARPFNPNLLVDTKRHRKGTQLVKIKINVFSEESLMKWPSALGVNQRLWMKRRSIILKMHDNACYYCGDLANTVDHIKPRHLGGTDHRDNLVAACADCNYGWTQQIPWRDKYLKKRLQGA
jgi:5-methylcytosine-specific restriction endonuclease McrA